ncbi:MAG: YhcH/YjgK/YiaL family protein [Heliobacteriaceae bacterium]|jgi:YhcH/YjgK/YiaL family protein|nr:YhcH/YjgK/YiaL family protein [Heliobacteriaceae bacterium]
MIYDDLSNLSKYNIVSDKVLEFLYGTNVEILQGCYDIDNRVTANVSVYYTKNPQDCTLESHEKYIDLQMIIKGEEQLDFIDVDDLDIKNVYDEQRDITFYDDPQTPLNSVMLTPYKFALIFPYEAHKPQMNYNGVSKEVRKVVVKIPVKIS